MRFPFESSIAVLNLGELAGLRVQKASATLRHKTLDMKRGTRDRIETVTKWQTEK